MGFDWIFVNPIQPPGTVRVASIRSATTFGVNPALLAPGSRKKPEAQVKDMVKEAERLGLRLMIDLVINHCAVDSPLTHKHPDWFRQEGGRIAHPFCLEEDGRKVVWEDLAQFDHSGSGGGKDLLEYAIKVVEHLIGLGFTGFRCDAAYQIPTDFWRKLIKDIRRQHPGVIFVAETLGCSPDQTRQTASAGFDAIFNSAKWWDFFQPLAAGAVRTDAPHRPLHRLSGEPRHPTPLRRVRPQYQRPQAALPLHGPLFHRRPHAHGL
jgi:starch synthase (maltosyl-transferring)